MNTRVRMIAGAAELMRRRGVNGTTMREVVRYTETPRGSIAHHFPGGKLELMQEAVAQAHREVSEPLALLLKTQGVLEGLQAFMALWRQMLEASAYEAGCAVLAASVEQYVPERQDPEGAAMDEGAAHLLDTAATAYADWQRIIVAALRKEGVPLARSRRLAALVVAAIEGTVGMCRSARSSQPLDDVWAELAPMLASALSKR